MFYRGSFGRSMRLTGTSLCNAGSRYETGNEGRLSAKLSGNGRWGGGVRRRGPSKSARYMKPENGFSFCSSCSILLLSIFYSSISFSNPITMASFRKASSRLAGKVAIVTGMYIHPQMLQFLCIQSFDSFQVLDLDMVRE